MPVIHHLNIKNAHGDVYCCLRNKVVQLDEEMTARFCSQCGMFGGTAGGQGVECLWEDARDVGSPYVVTDPIAEFRANQRRKVEAAPAQAAGQSKKANEG